MPPLEHKKNVRIGPVLHTYAVASLRYPWTLAATVLGVVVIQAANVISPLYLRQFVDTLSTAEPSGAVIDSLLTILTMFAGVALVGWVAQRIQAVSTMR